jgi:lipoprotein-releasing system permease protein
MRIAGQDPSVSRRALIELAIGVALIVAGGLLLATAADDSGYVIGGGPIFAGLVVILHSMAGFTGYKSFVAWRYLLNHPQRVTERTKLLAAAVFGIGVLLFVAGRLELFGLDFALGGGFDPGNPLQTVLALTAVALFGIVFWGILRFSKPAMIICIGGLFVVGLGLVGGWLVSSGKVSSLPRDSEEWKLSLRVLDIVKLGGGALTGLAMFFGCLRAFFTFFTTVPIGGVWIGTAALVCVLSVMSGFESDLRDKILGSNAHIQITREDGDFVSWREVKAKIDRIPGVVASTPYAASEVVIAANNNGMNVIIKGIDPETVGAVTDLISDLQDSSGRPDPEAMQRLRPLVKEVQDRAVPQTPRPANVLDPPPDDMPIGGDPIDFSRPGGRGGAGSGAGSAADADDAADAADAADPDSSAGSAAPEAPVERQPRRPSRPNRGAADPRPRAVASADDAGPRGGGDPELYGGDAVPILTEGVPPSQPPLDPPPTDLLTTTDEPVDYTQPGAITDEPVPVIDLPLEPTLSRRTQALPGILVGKELIKQTHLYTGEEVRVVSPLSDPSNPDATGTPIPFNRDYRVAGMFYTGMYEYDLKYVYVTLESLQDFLDRGDAIDGIEVRIADANDTGRYVPTDTSAGLIREALGPGYRIVDWRELNRSLFSALKLEKIAMFLVLGIVILVASFSIVGNLIMVVIEKAREIALLKTLGASDFGIMQLFAIQGLLIGLIGTILGVLTGLLLCWIGKRFGIGLNPDVYYIDRLPIHVDWQSVAAAGLAGVLISIAATLYPALLAARVRPAAGMRH